MDMNLRESEVYQIPEPNMFFLEDSIKKLNKKAVKLGCVPIELKIVDESFVEKRDENGKSVGFVKFLHVKAIGSAPSLNGWHLVGELQHIIDEENSTIIKEVPGETVPTVYRNSTRYNCDHCQKAIFRRETFVVKNENNEYKQVGRSCIKDFLGHHNPEFFLSWASFWYSVNSFFNEATDEAFSSGGSRKYLYLSTYLSFVNACVNKWGWMSKKKSEELYNSGKFDYHVPTTASRAIENILGYKIELENKVDITKEDHEKAEKIIEWAKEKFGNVDVNTLNNFEFNLRVISSLDMLDLKLVNIAACLVVFYNKEIEQYENVKKEEKISNYVGEIGKRMNFRLKLNKVTSYENTFGIGHVHMFEDENGNRFTWFTNCNNLSEGETYNIDGTVKDHTEFKGRKQTVITRCRVK